MSDKEIQESKEEAPNKGYSFMVGIVIAIVILLILTFYFRAP